MKLWNVYLLTFENGAVEALETAIEETVTWRIRTTYRQAIMGAAHDVDHCRRCDRCGRGCRRDLDSDSNNPACLYKLVADAKCFSDQEFQIFPAGPVIVYGHAETMFSVDCRVGYSCGAIFLQPQHDLDVECLQLFLISSMRAVAIANDVDICRRYQLQ